MAAQGKTKTASPAAPHPDSSCMASPLASGSNMSSFVAIDVLAAAGNAQYWAQLLSGQPAISLLAYHDDFLDVVGRGATARKVWDLPWEAFHEAGVYSKRDNALYVTSNYRSLDDSINVTVVSLGSDDHPWPAPRCRGWPWATAAPRTGRSQAAARRPRYTSTATRATLSTTRSCSPSTPWPARRRPC